MDLDAEDPLSLLSEEDHTYIDESIADINRDLSVKHVAFHLVEDVKNVSAKDSVVVNLYAEAGWYVEPQANHSSNGQCFIIIHPLLRDRSLRTT